MRYLLTERGRSEVKENRSNIFSLISSSYKNLNDAIDEAKRADDKKLVKQLEDIKKLMLKVK